MFGHKEGSAVMIFLGSFEWLREPSVGYGLVGLGHELGSRMTWRSRWGLGLDAHGLGRVRRWLEVVQARA